MKDTTLYRIEIDGVLLQQDHESYDKAMEAAHKHFAENLESKEAHIVKCTFHDLNVTVINKNTRK